MRKITQHAVSSFMERTGYKNGNTSTDGETLFLHNNAIARHTLEGLKITTAGWNTNTTRERLNGIPGVHVQQKKGVLYLNGNEWSGDWQTV